VTEGNAQKRAKIAAGPDQVDLRGVVLIVPANDEAVVVVERLGKLALVQDGKPFEGSICWSSGLNCAPQTKAIWPSSSTSLLTITISFAIVAFLAVNPRGRVPIVDNVSRL
jgi:hypothetical protein